MLYIPNKMNIELKSAWYTVMIITGTLIICLIFGVVFGFPRAFGALGLLGFLGLTPILFRPKKGSVACDERDAHVAKKATLVGGICSYLSVVLGGMILWFDFYRRGEELISIHWLPALVVVAAIVLYFTRSVFIISQYTSSALGSNE